MALFAACGLTPAMAGAIAVVVDPGLEVNELSFAELRKIMIGERQFWAAGQQIKLIVRAPVAAERNVLLRVYEMSEAQFRKYWIAKIFRAEATIEPLVTQSNEEAVGLVGVLRGAITFVDAVDVPDGLKVIRIDGRMPGEPGYRFN